MSEAPSEDRSGKNNTSAATPRVLLFHPVMWSHYKGVVFSALHEACSAANLSLHVVQVSYTEWERAILGGVDAEVHQYPHEVLFDDPYDRVSLPRRLYRVLWVVLAQRWDIIVLPGYYEPAMWAAAVVGKARGAKIIIESDSTYHDHERWGPREWVKSLLVKMCDMALCYGMRARTYIVSLGMPVERTVLRCQATDNQTIKTIHADFSANRGDLVRELGVAEKNFIFVGRLSPEKNVATLIGAFARVAARLDGWGLIIVGNGPLRAQLEEAVAPQLKSRITFHGGKGWRDVPKYFAAADILVLPSLSEPWGLVVNEALICGLPVLVSERCGCLPEIVIEGQTGYTFDPENVDQLARLMEDLAKDGEARHRISGHAAAVAARYTPERSATEMRDGFLRLLPSGNGNAG
jgi:glycosyltransferase involved in cell wall biosynthesis